MQDMSSNFVKILTVSLTLTVLPALVGVSTATAQEERGKSTARQVEELASKGAQAYRNNQYREAIGYFEDAYALQPVPNLLYNVGRCYEKLEEYEKAIEHYEEFAVAPEVGSEARREALKRAESLREIADIQKSDTSGTEGASAENDEGDKTGDANTSKTPIIVTASGAGLIGAGAVFGILASNSADQVRTGEDFQTRSDAQSRAKTQALVADSLYVAGAVVAGIGLYLLLSKDSGESEKKASTVVMPYAHDSGAGVGVRLDF